MRPIDEYRVEVLLTIALASAGYVVAMALHLSGPLAMVVAGLLIGNKAREKAMSRITEEYLDKFWEIVDELLNALLFVLIGLELMVVEWSWNYVWIGLISIGIMLLAGLIVVSVPISILRLRRVFVSGTIPIFSMGWPAGPYFHRTGPVPAQL